jgi:ABC-type Fe3+/spermidine/putrescine transport system ATPase subunit
MNNMAELVLEAAGIARSFRQGPIDLEVLRGVSLEVRAGERIAIIGASGSGKTTLLQILGGLDKPSAGSVTVAGRDIHALDERSRGELRNRTLGFIYQFHHLLPEFSALENVAMPLLVRRTPRHEAAERARAILARVGLGERLVHRPHELSGGERQRVALARALAPRPSLMLLDEPFASLDTNLRARVRDDVVESLRSTGTPAVFVTHDQHDALAIGDRIAVLRAGRLVQEGTPVEIFHRPVDRFVASFMGEASYLPVAAATDVAGLVVDTDLDAGATLMLRPDDIVLATGGDALVEHAEFRGTVWCYTVRLPGGQTVKSLRNHLEPIVVGAHVAASLRPGHQPVVVRA